MRIGGVILVGTKLRRVDENRDHDNITIGFRAPDEAEVSFVQRAHRGYKTDEFVPVTSAGEIGAQLRDLLEEKGV